MKKVLKIVLIVFAVIFVITVCLVLCSHKHQWSEWQVTKVPTCTENGVNTRMCDDCGESQTTSVPATGHAYGEWQTETVATCIATGIDAQYCTICNHKNTKTTYGNHQLNSQNICTTCSKQFINMTDAEKSVANEVYYISDREVEYDKTTIGLNLHSH